MPKTLLQRFGKFGFGTAALPIKDQRQAGQESLQDRCGGMVGGEGRVVPRSARASAVTIGLCHADGVLTNGDGNRVRTGGICIVDYNGTALIVNRKS